jgi:hypothetical protein
MRSSACAVLAVLCAVAPAASAQLYKWVDANGVVNYGDLPPDGVKLQPINHGTMSSVADRALVGNGSSAAAPAPSATRGAPSARRTASSNLSSGMTGPTGTAGGGGANDVVPYGPYPLRPLADQAIVDRRIAADAGREPLLTTERQMAVQAERRAVEAGVRPPMLPIDGVRELPAPARR